MKIYCMFGLPGSGKSSWIKNNLPKNIKIISKDLIRQELGIIGEDGKKSLGTSKEERQVKAIQSIRIKEAITKKEDFVIDDINLANPADLKKRLISAGANEDEIYAIKVETDPRICIQRRKDEIPPIAIWKLNKLYNSLDLSMYKHIFSVKGE